MQRLSRIQQPHNEECKPEHREVSAGRLRRGEECGSRLARIPDSDRYERAGGVRAEHDGCDRLPELRHHHYPVMEKGRGRAYDLQCMRYVFFLPRSAVGPE